jgi:hypothetical protein
VERWLVARRRIARSWWLRHQDAQEALRLATQHKPHKLYHSNLVVIHQIPLATTHGTLLLILLLLSAIPLSVYLHLYPHPSTVTLDSSHPTAAKMPQDLKKMMPQARMYRSGPYTCEAANAQKVEGETVPRRNNAAKDALIMKPHDNVETLYDILRHSAAKFGNAKCVGARKIVNVHEETKKIKKMVDGKEQEVDKKWQYFELSPYKYKSFVEFEKMALSVGAGLKSLGFGPQDRLHLFAATSMQWLASAHGKRCCGTSVGRQG